MDKETKSSVLLKQISPGEEELERYNIFRDAQLDSDFKLRFAKFVEDFCETSAIMQSLEARIDIAQYKLRHIHDPVHTPEDSPSNKKYDYVTKTSGEFLVRCSEIGIVKQELATIISLCSLEDETPCEQVGPSSLVLKTSSVEIDRREKKSIMQLFKTLRRGLQAATTIDK